MNAHKWIVLLMCLTCTMTGLAAPPKKNNKRKTMTAEEIRRYNIRRFDVHNIYVWGGAGYSGLLHPTENLTNGLNYTGDFTAKMLGGGGGLLGVGYEYNYMHLLLSVGPEFRLWSSADKLSFSNPYEITGLQYNQIKRYYLNNVREQQVLGQIMLPILVGGQWDWWYVKAGVKLGYTIWSSTAQQMDMQTSIVDPEAFQEWQTNMPNHYNSVSQSIRQKGTNPFGLDVALSAEWGIQLDQLLSEQWRTSNEQRNRPMRIRLAMFADFGLNNMSIRGDQPLATTLNVNELATQSWMTSEWGANRLSSMLIGVKATWQLQLNKVKEEKVLHGYLAVHTFDQQTLAPLAGTTLQMKNLATNKVSKRTTNSRGLTARREPEGNYAISAQLEGYQPIHEQMYQHSASNDTAQLAMLKVISDLVNEPMVDTIVPLPTVTEQPIVLDNLFFATNKTTILPQSEPDLLRLFQLLSKHPEIRIRITGHTDNVGTERANQKLSEGRANSVRQNMIDRGIDPSRIEAEGKGESMPVDTNDTDEGRQNNRRVEFIVL